MLSEATFDPTRAQQIEGGSGEGGVCWGCYRVSATQHWWSGLRGVGQFRKNCF